MPKVHGWKLSSYQPDPKNPRYVVDIHLTHMYNTPDVYWDARKNSYCLVEVAKPLYDMPGLMERYNWLVDGKRCILLSVNGAGEVRWDCPKDRILKEIEDEQKPDYYGKGDSAEMLAVARYFGLVPPRAMTDVEATVWGDSQER